MKELPRSECMYAGTPNRENREHKQRITDFADTSGQGNANGNREYSSMTVSIKQFPFFDGKGPLKSIFNLSYGCVAIIKVPVLGLKNCGFSSEHILHDRINFFTSSVEYGRFLVRKACTILVMPVHYVMCKARQYLS